MADSNLRRRARRFVLGTSIATMAFAIPAAARAQETPVSDERVKQLEAQIESLKTQLDEIKKALPKATPSWRGAPQFSDSAGWSFKPRGRMNLDAGFVEAPPGYVANRNTGFNTRFRRLRLGAEGTIPGGFGYKVEVDFASNIVSFGDVILTYAPKSQDMQIRIGNQESLSSLERMSSSNVMSFTERPTMNEAFINVRRLGAVLGYYPEGTDLRLETGLFAAHGVDNSFNNDGWIAAGRATWSPKALGGQLHFGVNAQHREFAENDGGRASVSIGPPSVNQLARYRARPFTLLTDVAFIDTGSFAAKSDDIIGVEAGGAWKGWYVAGEAQWLKAKAYRAGDRASGLDVFTDGNVAVTPTGNPGFFAGYAEIGGFLTGETRGYGTGTWQRTKVLKPVGKGGWGALQIAGRFEYIDLDSDKLTGGQTNNFTTGVATLAAANARFARGGTQTGYLLGVNWYPNDYVRFMLNYIHAEVEGGPFAAGANPASTDPVNERGYSTDSVALRAQVDF